MKSNTSKLLLAFLSVFILIFSSCEKVENSIVTETKQPIKTISFQELKSKIQSAPNIIDKLEQLSTKSNYNKSQTEGEFEVNLDSIKQFNLNADYESYTLSATKIIPNDDISFYKILIENRKGIVTSVIITFEFKNSIIVPVKTEPFIFSNYTNKMDCYDIAVMGDCNCHSHGSIGCQHPVAVDYYSVCSGSGSYDPASAGNGGGNPNTFYVVMSEEDAMFKWNTFTTNTSLSIQQKDWLLGNQSASTNLFLYLWTNDFSSSTKVFVKQLINFCIENPNVTFDEIFYNKTNLDSSSSIDTDNNTIGGYDNTVYADFNSQQQPWPTILSVIPLNQFVGWGAPGIKERNCMVYAKAQIAKKGYQISNYGDTGQTLQIYTEQNGVNQSTLLKGLSYLKYALSNDIPVIVGVDDNPGHPGNPDNSTDHFIVIVGMGSNSNGNYFQFYDNASGNASQGTNSLNLLYYNQTTGVISGSSQCIGYFSNVQHDYIITQIRKSKTKL